MNSTQLADRLVADTVAQLRFAELSYLPGFRIPCHYGGHQVGADTRADIAFTLGLLWDNGLREVAGLHIVEALRRVLFTIDGATTDTFFSYRVAETLARFGPITANGLLAEASAQQVDNLV